MEKIFMKYFLMVADYSIPILMIVSYPWWKKIANGEINYSSGFKTSRSIKNKENWKKANLLYGKYSFILGMVLFAFVIIMRYIQPVSMEWNSTIISTINIICMLVLGIFVNSKLKD